MCLYTLSSHTQGSEGCIHAPADLLRYPTNNRPRRLKSWYRQLDDSNYHSPCQESKVQMPTRLPILQLLNSAAITKALLKTLHNPPSVSITADSCWQTLLYHSLNTNLSAGRTIHRTERKRYYWNFRMLTHSRTRLSEIYRIQLVPSYQTSYETWRDIALPRFRVVVSFRCGSCCRQEVLHLNIAWPTVPPSTLIHQMQRIMTYEHLQLLHRKEMTCIDFTSTPQRRISVSGCLPVPHTKRLQDVVSNPTICRVCLNEIGIFKPVVEN